MSNGKTLFHANNGDRGTKLGVTDGTRKGTHILKDINTGYGSSTVLNFAELGNGKAIFDGKDATHGRELWDYGRDECRNEAPEGHKPWP